MQLPPRLLNRRTRLVDRLLLHPLVGPVLFLAIVLAMFQLLYAVGAPLQDLLGSGLDWVQTSVLEPALTAVNTPEWVRAFLIDGIWMGVGTVAAQIRESKSRNFALLSLGLPRRSTGWVGSSSTRTRWPSEIPLNGIAGSRYNTNIKRCCIPGHREPQRRL